MQSDMNEMPCCPCTSSLGITSSDVIGAVPHTMGAQVYTKAETTA